MAPIIPGTTLQSFVDVLRKATKDVFSQALNSKWEVEIDASDPAPSVESSAPCFQLAVSGGLQGNAQIQIEKANALLLAQTFLGEPLDPSAEVDKDRMDALEELLRQVAGLAATALGGLFHETKLEVTSVESATWQGVNVALTASDASSPKLIVHVRLSAELVASLSSATMELAAVTPIANVEASNIAATRESNFDLLRGVNLSLTLRFGQRILPLREILDLASGSVIELDHEVQDPADLLLGDKVIARGQVVIVDGNYGIRITEVTDARQRIGTL
jgi:flagellar motor switch protein FliN/FliY